MATCPDCHGDGQALAFVDWHNEQGQMEGDLRSVQCHFCGGTGKIDAGRMKRYKVGQVLRSKRLEGCVSQMEMSRLIGKRPSEISRIERGDCSQDDLDSYCAYFDGASLSSKRGGA